MQFPLTPKSLRRFSFPRFSFLRRPILRALPLLLLNGALVQVARAQSSGAAQAAQPSALYSLVSTLSIFAFFALLIGLFRPKTFAFLFKEKSTRGRVCGAFGAAWFFLVVLSGPLRPRPVATATTPTTVAQSAPGKDQGAVRVAENRAKAAEARAVRAEKAAASANASANAKAASKRGEAESDAPSSEVPAPDAATPKAEEDNVQLVDVPGIGKREAGVVDSVVYIIGRAETTPAIGPRMYRREADGVFYVLTVAARNADKSTHDVTTMLMKLVDDQGREFDPSSEGALALKMAGEKSAEAFSAQLQPGVTKKLTLVYDAPEGAQGLKLKIPAGFGFGQDALIKVPTAKE